MRRDDDVPRLSELESERVLALAILSIVLLLPAAIRHLPDTAAPVPWATCPSGAHRTADGTIRCGDPPPDTEPLTESELLLMGTPMDLTRATAEDLQLIPGIGPKLAARIIAAREAGDPTQAPGVGAKLRREIDRHTR